MANEKMLRGSKIRIFPTRRQSERMDLWRRRTLSLWNLLLELEQAAYSGDNTRSDIAWRSIWAQVVEERHVNAVDVYQHGKMRKDGTYRKEPGVGREEERETLKARLDELKKQRSDNSDEFQRIKGTLSLIAPKPKELDPEILLKIRKGKAAVDSGADPDEYEPKIFAWKDEMQAIMARLKRVPRTRWVGDLPSHAAQKVVEDLIRALEAMFRERKKRASGAGGRDTGFPKFKKNRYGAGSIYFANTQLEFDFENQRVKFPNGCGWMRCEIPRELRRSAIKKSANVKLMGGRVLRQGEHWYLSCQWELAKPDAIKPTGRTAGVKIGAKILLTTYDDRGQTREYEMPPASKKAERLYHTAAKRQSRAMEAHKRREAKLKTSGYRQRREQRLAAKGLQEQDKPRRLRRSAGFFRAAGRLAGYQAIERDRRDGFLHELTTNIVRQFDAIAVQRFEVASLMEKESTKRKRRLGRVKDNAEKDAPKENQKRQRPMKPVRKMMRHAAMARCGQLLAYKFNDLRGPGKCQEIDPHDPNAIVCSGCGTVHPEWRDVVGILKCQEVLADGTTCGTVLPRNRNAARVTKKELSARLKEKKQESV